MKKFLTSAIAAALVATSVGALVACGNSNDGNNNKDAELAQKGLATVIQLTENIPEETPQSYTVIGQTNAGSKRYDVKWSVSSEFPSYETYVSVGDKDSSGKVTINITKAQEVVEYTLKATVTVGKASKSEEFKHKIPAAIANENQTEVTINFKATDRAERTNFTATEQVWEQNGIKLTNTKSNFNDSSTGSGTDDVRLYKNSDAKIEYPGMSTIVFHTTGYDYTTALKTALDATGLGTATIAELQEGQTYVTDVTFVLTAPVDAIEFTLSAGQVRLSSIDVIANKNGATDQDRVNGANAALDLTNKTFTAAGTYDLPAEKLGATVTWAVKGTSANVAIEGGKLVISSMPESNAEVTLTATITCGTATPATKDITITLVPLGLENDGTQEHPYTPAEAWQVANLLTANSADEVYVKGYVVLPGTYAGSTYNNFDNMYIGDTYDSSKTYSYANYTNGEYGGIFYIYRPKATGDYLTADGLNAGDEVTFRGYLTNYNGTSPQLASGGICVARKAVEKSDEDIVKEAKAALTLAKTTFTKVNEEMALEATKKDAELTWKIKDGANFVTETDLIKIADGKLKVKALPATATTVTLTVTIKSNDVTDTKSFDITIEAAVTETTLTRKLALLQTNLGKKLYFTGTIDENGRGTTTENVTDAADIVITSTDDGYTFKVGDKYLELDKDHKLVFVDESTAKWAYDESKSVYTWTIGTTVYYLGTYNTFNTISASTINYATSATNFVTYFEDSANRTDAQKIADALKLVKAQLDNVTETGEVTLPVSAIAGVTLTWKLADDNSATGVTVADGKLNVSALPEGEDATVKLTVEATCGTATAQEKNVTVVLEALAAVNYGTVAEPLSVTETLVITAEQCKSSNNVTKKVVTTTGIVADIPADKGSGYYQYTLKDLTDSTKTIIVYSKWNLRDDVVTPTQNDVVIISGYIKNYNGTIEFAANGSTYVYVESNVRGTSTITLTENEDVTVTGLTATATNGSEVTFTVQVATGKELAGANAVKVNGNALQAENGSYKFTVAGNMTVTIETQVVGDTAPELLKTLSFTKAEAFSSAYTTTNDFTKDGMTWTIANFNSNSSNGGWDFIKCGRKGNASTGTITTKEPVAATLKQVIVKIDAASSVNYFKLLIADNANFDNAVEVELTIATGKNTFNVPKNAQGANKYYRIVIDCASGGSNGLVTLSSVELWGNETTTTPSTPEETETQTLSLPEAIVNED
ncbi:MAG: hypothetical protein K2M89_03930 [Clostridiales bacterium]|nr:hypothetical protein [Clostridiales bacterium]